METKSRGTIKLNSLLRIISLFFLSLIVMPTLANEIVIEGTVVDSSSQHAIANVNIFVRGTAVGTSSDQTGRFKLIVLNPSPEARLVLSHIAYLEKVVPLDYFNYNHTISLQKRSIPLQGVEVQTERRTYQYPQELTNSISVISSEAFDAKGYLDVADVLMTDQSTVIEETGQGAKTVSIRGANEDEVLILYDGVRLNNNFDNIFDISLIDPSSLDQIDIVKGGNIASAGAHGSSATINFIPKLKQDYLLKFYQRFGTYNSGDWGLNIFKDIQGLNLYGSCKEAALEQRYADGSTTGSSVIHETSYKLLNLSYVLGQDQDARTSHTLRSYFTQSDRGYKNSRDSEELAKSHWIYNLKYLGDFKAYGKLWLNASRQHLNENYTYQSNANSYDNDIKDKTDQLSCEYALDIDLIQLFASFNNENSRLNFRGGSDNLQLLPNDQTYRFHRSCNNYTFAVGYLNDDRSGNLYVDNIQFSLFFEQTEDHFPTTLEISYLDDNDRVHWNNSSYMFSSSLVWGEPDLLFKAHLNYGVNFRIPTLYQQLTAMLYPLNSNSDAGLLTEYKANQELGITAFGNQTSASAAAVKTEASLVIFRSTYENKFRMIQLGGTPLTVLDNYNDAQIFGLESYVGLNWRRAVSANLSYIKYIIPDKAAFPFKPDSKLTARISFAMRNWHLDLVGYREAERSGWIIKRLTTGNQMQLQEIILPEYNNFDVHLKKNFQLWKLECYLSASGRNILNKSEVLDGIAIRDRRFYLSFGLQF
jgi:outer membrane cobalamin receptor